MKFKYGFTSTPIQSIGFSDALLRTTHAVVGYLTFALVVALAASLRPTPRFIDSQERVPIEVNELEPVA